ncbi:MAG: EAL domain-containing protein [Magnetospirillum sp.]|nr:EAL domain-containing protein [Magnetospirillum sp.]
MARNVLLVDDEPRVLAALQRGLGHLFSLSCAASGAEALSVLDSQGPFAALVTDMRMPGMDGLELLREARRRVPEMVRLVLSGFADFEAVTAAVNEGAVFRYHIKPVAAEVLGASIESALVRHEVEKRAKGQFDPSQRLLGDIADLRQALGANQLRLYLQPQFRLADQTLAGAEALVRWSHPERGLLLPGQFLATAEAGGLLGDITAWMLDAVCTKARRWQDLGVVPLRIAANVTTADLADPGFPARVRGVLERHGLSPRWLELELTEGAAVTDMDGTRHAMDELSGMGLELAIDDFGSGYSSLGWLRRLPVGKVKIDRMFIQDIAAEPAACHIVEAIIALSGNLHLTVVAEGVETAAQRDALAGIGCDIVQGFLFGRPVPAAEFAHRLAKRKRE